MSIKNITPTLLLLFLSLANTKTQTTEIESVSSSVLIDSSKIKNKPAVAATASALIPGLGQVYNKVYWKVPVIWGSGLALYAYFDYNNTNYIRYRDANNLLNAEKAISDPEIKVLSQEIINKNKDLYRRNRDKAIIYMGVLYAANIIDALVDAHLLHYDISEDLSLRWEPTIINSAPQVFSMQSSTIGAKIHLLF